MRPIHRLVCFIALATACATTAAMAASGAGNITQLGFRYAHRCVMHEDGAIDCVSENSYLGGSRGSNGSITFRPVRMIARGATQLATGGFASCAIVGGALDCWNTVPASGKKIPAPRQIITSGVTDISIGDDHACAVAHGDALCWGNDSTGQSGYRVRDYGNGDAQATPLQAIAQGVTRVAAGGDRSCAVATGALWCWGNTGLASDPHFMDPPGEHPPLRVFEYGATAVAAGAHHVCAIVNGALWCWGDNSHGQIGIGISVGDASASPAALPHGARGTFMNGEQTCFWEDWNHLTCQVERPVKIIDQGVSAIWARSDETCALVHDALWCWGANAQGQLGIATTEPDVLKPTLTIASGVTFVTLDRTRTCAVMHGGALRCTLPCTRNGDAVNCPDEPGFVAGDPTSMHDVEARVGVWRGTIGDAKVMACLQSEPFSQSSYYYLRHGFGIPLALADHSGATWNEDAPEQRGFDVARPTAVWKMQMPVHGHMEGSWTAADGSHTTPIHLVRVMALDTGDSARCDTYDGAFNAPRIAAQKLRVEPSKDGLRRVSTLDGHISMAELPDSIPNAAHFNQAMHEWFAAQITGYYDCAFSNGGKADFDESYDIDLLAPPWLVARETFSAYCGGAYPSGGTAGYAVWNLDTGKAVDPWDFINKGDHCDNADVCQRQPPPKLKAILVARFKQDNADAGDCADAIDIDSSYLLHPEKNGLVFSTTFPHVIQACDEDITVSWKTLTPFLSKQGEAARRSLQQVRKPPGS